MPSAPKWVFDVFERLLSPDMPLLEVTENISLSQNIRKICFKGDLKNFDFQPGYHIDFRVSDTDVRRYTPSYYDVKNGILEFIYYLHGDAPGTRFMTNLQPGDTININQPRGHKYYDPSAEKYIIFGDETSLGLACSLLPLLKQNAHQFCFYFELDEENKDIPEKLGLQNVTVFTKGVLLKGESLIQNLPAFQEADWEDAHFVLTGNVRSVQTLRKLAKIHAKGKVHAHGYWLEGKKGL
ncbi:siderophore-interacting protein [Flavobacterium psychrotrophum]|uniref:siderophore-interacting protein n=1 Tax=Flavobacterium psychrotrophum TaxID=2294119 RepID=UPI000E31BFD4|nr:siderophore-interacting protein [Flavobacterium psychrotrophum]